MVSPSLIVLTNHQQDEVELPCPWAHEIGEGKGESRPKPGCWPCQLGPSCAEKEWCWWTFPGIRLRYFNIPFSHRKMRDNFRRKFENERIVVRIYLRSDVPAYVLKLLDFCSSFMPSLHAGQSSPARTVQDRILTPVPTPSPWQLLRTAQNHCPQFQWRYLPCKWCPTSLVMVFPLPLGSGS